MMCIQCDNTTFDKVSQLCDICIAVRDGKMKLIDTQPDKSSAVDHPAHYGGADNPYEVIKVIKAWGYHRNFAIGNTLKYIGRAGLKGVKLVDLEKARWYLDWEIARLKAGETDAD